MITMIDHFCIIIKKLVLIYITCTYNIIGTTNMKIITISLVLIALIYCTFSQAFTSYQKILTCSPQCPGGSTSTFNYPMTFNSSSIVALAHSCFDFRTTISICFFASVQKSGTNVAIQLNVCANTIIYKINYYVIHLDNTADWAWIISGNYQTSTLTDPNAGATNQTLVLSAPVIFSSLSDYKIINYLAGFYIQTFTGYSATAILKIITSLSSSNQISLIFEKYVAAQRSIFYVNYTIFLYNTAQMVQKKISHYASLVLNDKNLTAQPANFGIPNAFLSNSSIDGNCIIGITNYMYFLFGSGDLFSLFFDATVNPINLISNTRSNSALSEALTTDFYILCTLKCGKQTYLNNSINQCANCSSECQTCINNTFCISCVNNTYYVNTTYLCQLCNVTISNCINCTNSTYCLFCNSTYFINSINMCQLCSSFMLNCANCTNDTYCTSCVSNIYMLALNGSGCFPCGGTFSKCLQCTQTQCTLCEIDSFLRGGLCHCYLGISINGICINIPGCVQPFQYPNYTKSCLSCNTSLFESKPVNGLCKCIKGTLINRICSTIEGCLTPYIASNGQQFCAYCNVMTHFSGLPQNQINCGCQSLYSQNGATCQDICGDGFDVDPSTSYCDDGNVRSGDGCSSICQVETKYKCEKGSKTSRSICVYVGGPIKATLASITKSEDQNMGIIKFKLSPPVYPLNEMIFSNYFTLDCGPACTISNMHYSSSILQIDIYYTQKIEGNSCMLYQSYNKTLIKSPAANLQFKVVSQNLPLLLTENFPALNNLKFIFTILSYIAICVFLFSLPHKMIGVELLTCCQLIYLSNSLHQITSPYFNSVHYFQLVTGYRSMFYQQQYSSIYPPFSFRLDINRQFLQNSLILCIVLAVTVTILLVLKNCVWMSSKEDEIDNLRKQQNEKNQNVQKILSFLYDWVIFPVTAGFFPILVVSGYINNIIIENDTTASFPVIINAISQIFVYVAGGAVFGRQFVYYFSNNRDLFHLQPNCEMKKWYVLLYLTKSMFVMFLIQLQIWISFNSIITIIMCAIVFIFLIIILVCSPYKKIIDTLGAVVCQMTSLFALSFVIFNKYFSLSQSNQIYIILALQAMIVLSILLSLVRMILVYKNLIIQWRESQHNKDTAKVKKQSKKTQNLRESIFSNNLNKVRINFTPSPSTINYRFVLQPQKIGNQIKEQFFN